MPTIESLDKELAATGRRVDRLECLPEDLSELNRRIIRVEGLEPAVGRIEKQIDKIVDGFEAYYRFMCRYEVKVGQNEQEIMNLQAARHADDKRLKKLEDDAKKEEGQKEVRTDHLKFVEAVSLIIISIILSGLIPKMLDKFF